MLYGWYHLICCNNSLWQTEKITDWIADNIAFFVDNNKSIKFYLSVKKNYNIFIKENITCSYKIRWQKKSKYLIPILIIEAELLKIKRIK